MSEEFSIKDFIISLGLVSTTIILTFLPLFGIVDGGEDEGSSAYSIFVTLINGSALLLIVFHELFHFKSALRGSLGWYIGIPLLILVLYLFDIAFHHDMGKTSYNVLFFFLPNSVPGIFIANYIYRYDKMNVLIKNLEPLFIVGTLGLIMSVPSMYSLSYAAHLAAGGGHQTISYCSAIFCSYFVIIKITSQNLRYTIFNNRYFNILETIFIPCLLFICFMGGGRGGALLLMVNALLIVFLFFRQNFGKLFLYSILVILLSYIALNALSNSELFGTFIKGLDRSLSYINEEGIDMGETSGRDHVYSDIMELISESPIIGHGVFHCYDVCFANTGMPYSHNLFLEILLQGGILYLLLSIFILGRIIKTSFFYIKNYKNQFLPLFSYPFIILMVSGTYMKSCLFWFLLVYMLNMSKEYKYKIYG